MARILLSSGPTREYLDPVRYISNGSSGQMGAALAESAIAMGHEVVIVSGPVEVSYPESAKVVPVVSTREMLSACQEHFAECEGFIATAAPCDYGPAVFSERKLKKTDSPLALQLVQTPDIAAALGREKTHRWLVCFALETHEAHTHAAEKLARKNADLIVLNGPEAINRSSTRVEVMTREGQIAGRFEGTKKSVAKRLFALIETRLITPN